MFPITIALCFLPAAGDGGYPQDAGAEFNDPIVDPIFGRPPLELLTPEELGPPEFLIDSAPLVDLIPTQSGGTVGGIVEEEHLRIRVAESPFQLSDGNEDEGVPGDSGSDADTDTPGDHNQVTITFIGNNLNGNNLSNLVAGGDLPYNFTFNDVSGDPVLYTGGVPALSKDVPVLYHKFDDKTLIGFADENGDGLFTGGVNDTGDYGFDPDDRIVFVVTLDEGGEGGAWKLEIYDQIDHPLTDDPDLPGVQIAYEDILFFPSISPRPCTSRTATAASSTSRARPGPSA
jgi:hypothetical protein